MLLLLLLALCPEINMFGMRIRRAQLFSTLEFVVSTVVPRRISYQT